MKTSIKPERETQAHVPPLVAWVLRDESNYGDGPPTWPSAPTSKRARNKRKRYVKRLRRFEVEIPEARPLADHLASCKKRRRCMSGACPECGRAFQRWLVGQLAKLASDKTSLGQLDAVSIAFPHHRIPQDQLTHLDTTRIKRSLSETTKNVAGLAWLAGGIDLSLNDDTQKDRGIGWQPQFYGFADIADVTMLSKVLRDTYRPSKTAPRPVQIKAWDGSSKASSYAFKPEFVRRIAYEGQAGPPENRRECWRTRKVSLRPAEHVQAMLWMHRVGIAGRLFLKGLRMTRVGDSVGLVKIRKLE